PNWPTGMVPPLQSTSETVAVNVPSSVVIGFASCGVCTVTAPPEPACGDTITMGWSIGNWTRSPVTSAKGDSLGTRNVRMASDVPAGTDDGLTVTCAPAAPAQVTRTAMMATAPTRARRAVGGRDGRG